jgi:hypothetical protein
LQQNATALADHVGRFTTNPIQDDRRRLHDDVAIPLRVQSLSSWNKMTLCNLLDHVRKHGARCRKRSARIDVVDEIIPVHGRVHHILQNRSKQRYSFSQKKPKKQYTKQTKTRHTRKTTPILSPTFHQRAPALLMRKSTRPNFSIVFSTMSDRA